jgi:hypothetical protein
MQLIPAHICVPGASRAGSLPSIGLWLPSVWEHLLENWSDWGKVMGLLFACSIVIADPNVFFHNLLDI